MAHNQVGIKQATVQAAVEAPKAAVQAMAVDMSECSLQVRSTQTDTGSKLDRPNLKQPTFD